MPDLLFVANRDATHIEATSEAGLAFLDGRMEEAEYFAVDSFRIIVPTGSHVGIKAAALEAGLAIEDRPRVS